MRSWLDTFLGIRNRGRNRPWTRRVGGRASVQSQWNRTFLVWSDAFGRIERALHAQFRNCVRGAADTRVTASQNRKMSQNESRIAANPALRGAHLGQTKSHGQVDRMGTIWGYAELDRHNGAGCIPAHRSASGHLAQGL